MDELSGDMQYLLQAFTDLEDRFTRIENAQGKDQNSGHKIQTPLKAF